MKTIIQNLKNGEISLLDSPKPSKKDGHLIIATESSLISSGTEKMLIDFGKANFIEKAKQQPEKVKKALQKVKNDGIYSTASSINAKLDTPLTLGYSNAGIIVENENEKFKIGDRVVSNGAHSEVVSVPYNLCAKIPNNVSNEAASFTVLGSISMQGIRLLNPTIGESIVVIGLGLVGLLSVQILRANGCQVLGIDYSTQRCELAKSFGAEVVDLSKDENPINIANNFSKNKGVDGALITASTKSNDPVHQAAQMCRKRGKIILVGVTGLNLNRNDFYEKELTFQVSCSYGPGRYDDSYELGGNDYPFGFVRWTEQRNFEAVLQLISEGKINTNALTTHIIPFHNAKKAYEIIQNDKSSLGVVFDYGRNKKTILSENSVNLIPKKKTIIDAPTIGFIGAGNYASKVLIPAFLRQKVNLKTLASINGRNSAYFGNKFGFNKCTSDLDEIFNDDEINTIVIASRHDSHADLALKSIKSNKNIFLEKPLCLNIGELDKIRSELDKNNEISFTLGFNRRFSPFTQKIKNLLKKTNSPLSMIMTINAGHISSEHWTQSPDIGGGRIIGEACHFIDLLRFLADSKISSFGKISMDSKTNDTLTINLYFENGSIGTIHYFANGNSKQQKERLEVFSEGRYILLDNFKKLTTYGFKRLRKTSFISQNKGQKECVEAFCSTIKNQSDNIIPLEEIFEVSKISIELSS